MTTPAREPSAKDFSVDIDGLGTFTFARRSLRDELRIAAEVSRLTEGVEAPTDFLSRLSGWVATLKVLTVSAPDSWNIDAMDPLADETYETLMVVYGALRAKESSFRQRPKAASEAGGQGTIGQT